MPFQYAARRFNGAGLAVRLPSVADRLNTCLLGPLLIAALLSFQSASLHAEPFPSRPITIVVGLAAGGGTDVQVRALARAASKELGQPVIIENRVGVAATLGPSAVARGAAPDGYTLAVSPTTLFRMPYLMKVNYDPMKDFTYIANITSYSYSLSVARDSRFKNVKELIEFAKSNPGKLAYATSVISTADHLIVDRLGKLAGVEFNPVPYKSSAEAFAAVLGGHVDFTAVGGFGAPLDGGRIRSLGMFSEERLRNRPAVPTLKEQGYHVVSKSSWGIAGPKNMPPAVVKQLNEAFRKATLDPEFRRILQQEDQPLTFMTSEEYTAYAAQLFVEEGVIAAELGIKKPE